MRRWMVAVVVMSGCEGQPPPEAIRVSAGHLKLECPRHSVRAFDASRSLLAGPALPCRATVGDRQGAPLAGVALTLLTEAGRLRAAGPADAEGVIEVTHEVSMPAPLDVSPGSVPTPPIDDVHTGQPLAPAWMRPELWVESPSLTLEPVTPTRSEPRRPDPIRLKANGTGRVENNPRDNLVTLVALVKGEENFTDTNGNGTQDGDEPFDDLTEPFVDADDNATWDPGEVFVDANANSTWDGKNGRWDAETLVWVQERVLWTGELALQDAWLLWPGVVGHKPTLSQNNLTLQCPTLPCASAIDPRTGLPGVFRFYLSDPWFNAMARSGPEPHCFMAPQEGTPPVTFGPVITNVDGTLDAPAGWTGSLTVTDVRDPNNPTTNRPSGFPPLKISATVLCRFNDGSERGTDLVHLTFNGLID
ncbi:MAG: hypothetical protein Q8L48_28970 [Archangium sp.]|nr:hypothetical protein [Archangium sp.]